MSMDIGFLVFPDMLQLDLTGAYAVFAAVPETRLHLTWKNTRPLLSSDKLILTPTISMVECPPCAVFCVPGGGGIDNLLQDRETLDFLRKQASGCRYLCSVCTGALALGAAGLLDGYRATTHWQSMELLAPFGAKPLRRRVVLDRTRASSAGVSAGIDMALTLAGELWGEAAAQEIQLRLEYAPEPPYDGGSPDTAPPQVLEAVARGNGARREARRRAVLEAAARLRAGSTDPP
jgi:cyclohexyl-isocyanide hydratase